MKKSLVAALFFALVSVTLSAAVSFSPFIETEQGFVAVLHHTYQNGVSQASPGSDFDFRNQGGQEILFPFERYAVGAVVGSAHRAWLTYQPLRLETDVKFRDDVTVGGILFTDGTAMDLTYSFPFYRVTYTYDILSKHANADLGFGLAVQIRNASIVFSKADGTDTYVSQNVGIVPALAIYSRYEFPFGLVLSADIAGTYATSQWFNGADFEFEGSILDASLRMGYLVQDHLELFGNLRFFGGTAKGSSEYAVDAWTEPTTRYTKNNIAALTVSVGVKKAW